jgi:hypothetical protein
MSQQVPSCQQGTAPAAHCQADRTSQRHTARAQLYSLGTRSRAGRPQPRPCLCRDSNKMVGKPAATQRLSRKPLQRGTATARRRHCRTSLLGRANRAGAHRCTCQQGSGRSRLGLEAEASVAVAVAEVEEGKLDQDRCRRLPDTQQRCTETGRTAQMASPGPRSLGRRRRRRRQPGRPEPWS